MTQNKRIDIEKIELDVADLMIESDHPEDNAYNWGLSHAMLLLNGVDTSAIKTQRERMRNAVR